MSNHRSKCQYCKQMVLSRDIGQHILKKHESLVFAVPENLQIGLWKDKFLTKPLWLLIDGQYYFFCLADYSCIKNEIMADRHFKGNEEKHKEQILKLREKYPLNAASSTEGSRPTLSEKEKLYIYEEFAQLIGALRCYEKRHDYHTTDLDKKSLELFNKLGLRLDDDYLKSLHPECFTSDEPETKEEDEVVEEEEDDILPFVVEKPMTREEYIRKNFTKKDILNLSTNVATGQIQHVPELEAFTKLLEKPSAPPTTIVAPRVSTIKRKPKEVEPSAPAPAPTPTPAVDEFPPLDYTKPVAPWELFIRANSHAKTDHERIAIAREIGFPNHQIPHEVLHHQSAARIVTLPSVPIAPSSTPIPRLIFNTKAIRKPKTTDC